MTNAIYSPNNDLIELSSGMRLPILQIDDERFLRHTNFAEFASFDEKTNRQAKILKGLPQIAKYAIRKMVSAGSGSLSGIKTLAFKLGPGLSKESNLSWFYKYYTSKSIALGLRIRLVKICELQVAYLRSILSKDERKGIRFVNIGGGPSVDSLNVLLALSKPGETCLANRDVEITIFDKDDAGPEYAERCLALLKKAHRVDDRIRVVKIDYDWSKPDELSDYLDQNKENIIVFVSEGGLFEYGSQADIANNLRILQDHTGSDVVVFGSVIKSPENVNQGYRAMNEIIGVDIQYWGMDGLNDAVKDTDWQITQRISVGRIFDLFEMEKVSTIYS
jgi:hypothetical protein